MKWLILILAFLAALIGVIRVLAHYPTDGTWL
jgi:membrane-associated phospholipid phosphatase